MGAVEITLSMSLDGLSPAAEVQCCNDFRGRGHRPTGCGDRTTAVRESARILGLRLPIEHR